MKIGLIAGGGQFPVLFSKKAAQKGHQVYAIGFNSETDNNLSSHVSRFGQIYLGQVSKLIKFFRQNGVDKAVLLGSINKKNIFRDIRPDFKALSFIAKNIKTHDDSVLSSFAELLLKEGIEILPSTFLLPDLLSPRGCWTKKKPDSAQNKDIVQGWKIAKQIGRLDIGQCIVISNGSVLAVEAIDGTDATIARGGALSGKTGAVLVKLSKPCQDLRFDLPSTGLKTIETMAGCNVNVLALEAEKSLSFDRDEMITFADANKITIVGLTENDIETMS